MKPVHSCRAHTVPRGMRAISAALPLDETFFGPRRYKAFHIRMRNGTRLNLERVGGEGEGPVLWDYWVGL